MSDQGAIPDRRVSDFGLIETLLWTRDEGFFLLAEHLERLRRSSARLGFRCDESRVVEALTGAAESFPGAAAARLRVRIVLSADGAIESSAAQIEPVAANAVWTVAIAERRFDSGDPLLRHKTTRRELYETELARANADEVLFLNERDEVCEGARANVFLAREGVLLTPPLSSGLLPGTLRAHLLREGRAREAVLRLADFEGAEFYMGNSVRGLVRGRCAGDHFSAEPRDAAR
jgi:4-amino-4-deoxychorismate lyase/para-aminobenzoate synthetase/4-amino-4-deoxychorismate lyase